MPKLGEVIRKEGGKWYLYTADGTRRLGGPYTSRDLAVKREQQIQFFKHQGEEEPMPKGKTVKKETGVVVPKGYKPKMDAAKLRLALGIKEAGNEQDLIDSFGDWAGGSVRQCISQLEGKEGIEDPATLCAWMKDQWSGTTSWRGEVEEVGEDYGMSMPDMGGYAAEPMVPMNVLTFADMQKQEEATSVANNLKRVNKQFCDIIYNILWSSEEDKVGKLYSLVYEYSALLPQELDVTMGASEAATVKASVKSAIKALNALLEDKTLPKTVTAQVNALRETFRKTWKDLETEASEEPAEEAEPVVEPVVEEVEPQEENTPLPEKITESYEGLVTLASEAQTEPNPLEMDVVLIKPGWGNTRDNHYYPRELLTNQNTVEKFIGSKMYESDHKPGEKSTRTWVSTVTSAKGYTSDGSPIVRVAVHDPNFAQRIINLDEMGLLNKMECSILADATAERKAYQEGGRTGKKILEITNVESVDWVTRAGAGGHALRVAEDQEGAQQTEEVEPAVEDEPVVEENQEGGTTVLTKEQVQEILGKTRLPQASQDRLVEASYEDEAAVEKAITSEVEYLKAVTSSGKPFTVGESEPPAPERVSEADVTTALDGIDQAFGIKK